MESPVRTFSAAILAATFVITNAFAAPLDSGKPAGVKKAQVESPNAILIVTGLGLAGLGIGLVASSNGGGPITSTTAAITTSSNTP